MKKKNLIIIIFAVFFAAGVYVVLSGQNEGRLNSIPVPFSSRPKQQTTTTPESKDIEIILTNLEIPWEIAFLPDGRLLITQRPGQLILVGQNQQIIEVEGVSPIGEGGLLGMALHPAFSQNKFIYLYLTSRVQAKITNRAERYVLDGNQLTQKTVILDGIQGSAIHDGGRIKFGPEGFLYITTGDAGNPQLSQDLSSLNGKILRLEDDGLVPEDNPFGDPIWSYGHRNPQGLTWDDQGRLWATEHGRSGIRSGFDELNLIEKGKNYGWPSIQGSEKKPGMISPVVHSGPQTTWAPAGIAFYRNSLFFTGLRGQTLYEYKMDSKELKTHLVDQFGRLRAIGLGPDDYIYISTSNRDGRGSPSSDDDRIIKVNPRQFF